jgi:hypothetical protein
VAFRVFSLLFVCLAPLRAQTAGLEGNKSLFTVLAALNAAGYDADLASPTNHPLRAAIRTEIAKRKPASVPDLKDYFRRHRQDNAQAELRLYASWALLVTDPPAFEFKHKDHQLPPEVLNLRDLAPLMTRFYEEANIDDLWKRSQPAYEQFATRYHEPRIASGHACVGLLALAAQRRFWRAKVSSRDRSAGPAEPDPVPAVLRRIFPGGDQLG